MKMEKEEKSKSKNIIDLGRIEKNYEYSQEPRLEGLLKQLKYIKWKNVKDFKSISKEV